MLTSNTPRGLKRHRSGRRNFAAASEHIEAPEPRNPAQRPLNHFLSPNRRFNENENLIYSASRVRSSLEPFKLLNNTNSAEPNYINRNDNDKNDLFKQDDNFDDEANRSSSPLSDKSYESEDKMFQYLKDQSFELENENEGRQQFNLGANTENEVNALETEDEELDEEELARLREQSFTIGLASGALRVPPPTKLQLTNNSKELYESFDKNSNNLPEVRDSFNDSQLSVKEQSKSKSLPPSQTGRVVSSIGNTNRHKQFISRSFLRKICYFVLIMISLYSAFHYFYIPPFFIPQPRLASNDKIHHNNAQLAFNLDSSSSWDDITSVNISDLPEKLNTLGRELNRLQLYLHELGSVQDSRLDQFQKSVDSVRTDINHRLQIYEKKLFDHIKEGEQVQEILKTTLGSQDKLILKVETLNQELHEKAKKLEDLRKSAEQMQQNMNTGNIAIKPIAQKLTKEIEKITLNFLKKEAKDTKLSWDQYLKAHEQDLKNLIRQQGFSSANMAELERYIDEKITELGLTVPGEQGKSADFDNSDRLKGIVEDLVSQSNHLKPRKIDFALYSSGGRIDHSQTSKGITKCPRLPFGSQICKMLKFLQKDFGKPPETAISADNSLGMCWPFTGNSGQITLDLAKRIIPEDIEVEHINRYIAKNIDSAPRKFSVWIQLQDKKMKHAVEAQLNIEAPKRVPSLKDFVYMGTFEYDVFDDSPIQTFKLPVISQNRRLITDKIIIKFESNWGNKVYTCIYQVRVFGQVSTG